MERFQGDALKVNPRLKIMAISCKTDEGLDTCWFEWIKDKVSTKDR